MGYIIVILAPVVRFLVSELRGAWAGVFGVVCAL